MLQIATDWSRTHRRRDVPLSEVLRRQVTQPVAVDRLSRSLLRRPRTPRPMAHMQNLDLAGFDNVENSVPIPSDDLNVDARI